MKYNFDEVIIRESTHSVKYDLREKIFGQDDIIPMWVADMDFATPDFIREAVKERADHPVYGYSIRPQLYFDSIRNWQEKHHHWKIKNDWIRFSPGIVPAVNLCVQAFTRPGDKIIVQPPVYFPFFSAIKNNKRIQLDNPLKLQNGRLSMDFDDLRSKIDKQTRMILLCSPHNPGGSVWRKEELQELAGICIEHGILIVSDEIHCDLVFPPNKHIPTATLSGEIADQTISCIAPSKTFNLAGMATSSVIVSNDSLAKRFDETMEQLHVGGGNLFGTIASIAAYTKGDEWLQQLLDYLQENARLAVEFINHKVRGIQTWLPESTYMLWLDCRELDMEDEELWNFFIRQAGLGFNKGQMFGQGGEGFMRLNFACPRQILMRALHQLAEAVNGET